MKKILLFGSLLLTANLFAFEMCELNLEIDKEFTPKSDWVKKQGSFEKDNEKFYYEKIKGINTCQVHIDKNKKIEKLTKVLNIKSPLTTPEKLDNLTFKSGFNFYYKDKKGVEFESANYQDFLNSLKEGINTLRVSKVNYQGNGLVASVNTMCSELGRNCKSIIELKKPELDSNNQKVKNNNNQLNFMLNQAIESQNLKLKSTEGWQ